MENQERASQIVLRLSAALIVRFAAKVSREKGVGMHVR